MENFRLERGTDVESLAHCVQLDNDVFIHE